MFITIWVNLWESCKLVIVWFCFSHYEKCGGLVKPFHVLCYTAAYQLSAHYVSSFLIHGCCKLKHSANWFISYELFYLSFGVPLWQAARLIIVCSFVVFVLTLIFWLIDFHVIGKQHAPFVIWLSDWLFGYFNYRRGLRLWC